MLLGQHCDVLLLDEPTNHLSLTLAEELEEALQTAPIAWSSQHTTAGCVAAGTVQNCDCRPDNHPRSKSHRSAGDHVGEIVLLVSRRSHRRDIAEAGFCASCRRSGAW